MREVEYRRVMEHIEVYDKETGEFLVSADNMAEAEEEVKKLEEGQD